MEVVKGRKRRWTKAGICVAMMRIAMRSNRRVGEKGSLYVFLTRLLIPMERNWVMDERIFIYLPESDSSSYVTSRMP